MKRKRGELLLICDSHSSFVRVCLSKRWLIKVVRTGKKPAGAMKLEVVLEKD